MQRKTTTSSILVIWTFVLSALANQAQSQIIRPWAAGFEIPFRSSITSDDLEAFMHIVGPDAEQNIAAQWVFKDHEGRFHNFVQENEGKQSQIEDEMNGIP